MDHLAREGDADGGIAPLEGPVVLATHSLQKGRLSRVLAVTYRFVPTPLQGYDEALVNGSGGSYPFVVGAGEGIW